MYFKDKEPVNCNMKEIFNKEIPSENIRMKPTFLLVLICGYIFLAIERPWESVSMFNGVRIERYYAIFMIIIAMGEKKFILVESPTNKWVLGLLSLHFILAPFAFNPSFAVEQGLEYSKVIVLYILMLAITNDEKTLKLILKAYVFSMIFYVLHSLWEFHNGRHAYRMGIVRMIGVDSTFNDPNSFGASIVLSFPIVYALVRFETKYWIRKLYYSYFFIAVVCVVLTGSRTSFVAMVFAFLILVIKQKGKNIIIGILIALIACGIIWNFMPEDKKVRIQSIWDEDAGPKNAHESAMGRFLGLEASWEMFKQAPFTGVGAGGKNYIGYRILYGDHAPFQAHILYGEVIAELGIIGAFFFTGLILSMLRCCKSLEPSDSFLYAFGRAIIACILLLLVFGIGGHNFYRPMWLWLAAWSGSLLRLSIKHSSATFQKL